MKYAATVGARVVIEFDPPVEGPQNMESLDTDETVVNDARVAAAKHAETQIVSTVDAALSQLGVVADVVVEAVEEIPS